MSAFLLDRRHGRLGSVSPAPRQARLVPQWRAIRRAGDPPRARGNDGPSAHSRIRLVHDGGDAA